MKDNSSTPAANMPMTMPCEESYAIDDRALKRPADCVRDRLKHLLADSAVPASMLRRTVGQSRIPN